MSEEINHERRRFIGTVATALAAFIIESATGESFVLVPVAVLTGTPSRQILKRDAHSSSAASVYPLTYNSSSPCSRT